MALAKQNPKQLASARDLKHRVLTCLNKLSDRDTHSAAAAELESIARALSLDSFPPFISSISATDASDKSPVRKQCLRLFSLLSESHGDSLSPFLPKILSAVVRRLRDPDSVVRSACVDAIASVSSHITEPPFQSISKPLVEALVTEQDQNSQIGAALCLASAIDASADPDSLYLKKLLPRLEKLLKSESFKAKPALMTLIASIIGAGGASSRQLLKNLVPFLVEYLSSEDWAARKASAEALLRLALVEKNLLPEFKASYVTILEAKKFDKVKIVRESMNQMVEAWKEIPDISDEASAPPELESSCKEDASDGQNPPNSRTPCSAASGGHLFMAKKIPVSRPSLPDNLIMSGDKRTGPAMFRKLDHQKATDSKMEFTPHAPSSMSVVSQNNTEVGDEKVEDRDRLTKRAPRRALFNKNAGDRMPKFGGFKAGSRVVPCQDEDTESTIVVSNDAEDIPRNQKECEDLSLIRNQLVQLENQQSHLLDLLQKFIGSSQNGMRSLETRVHGLELALDEISFDLAVSTGRMPKAQLEGTTCCKIPGAEFLSSKFRRRTEGQLSASQFPSYEGTPSVAGMRSITHKTGDGRRFKLGNRRFGLQDGGGFIVNPLADIHNDFQGISEVSSERILKNIHGAV